MKLADIPMIIPILAIFYLVFVYVLLSLAQRSKKVLPSTNNDLVSSSQNFEN